MTWTYNNIPVTEINEQYLGFVYRIQNLENGMIYYGQKKLKFRKTKQVNKKKKKITVESDWRDYFGSNRRLLEDVERLGKDKFKREILFFCLRKSEMNLLELYCQVDNRVLGYPDKFYNDYIGGRISRKQIGNNLCSHLDKKFFV